MSAIETYKRRRAALATALRDAYKTDQGFILVCGGFERERSRFRQDSYFHYLTGVSEPAAMLLLRFDGAASLYVPNFGGEREKWVTTESLVTLNPQSLGFSAVKNLSEPRGGYAAEAYFEPRTYSVLLQDLEQLINAAFVATAVRPRSGSPEVYNLFIALEQVLVSKGVRLEDASSLLDELRRHKDGAELLLIQKAIDATVEAHRCVARAIKAGKKENELQALIEKTFIEHESFTPAFPSIVATGKNTTILHYTNNNQFLQEGDLLVVDIGAEIGMYAADLTRTYPVGGKFNERQAFIYQLVLDAQQYVASLAKPGMFLRNTGAGERSLHWHTVSFFKKHGLEQFFPHGIGHYMGLDVHDVGTYATPLAVGDVFTIEPGLYLPAEALGVRIEDDFLMTENGAVCLSSSLPSSLGGVEALMQG